MKSSTSNPLASVSPAYSALVAGTIVLLLGATVLVGWFTHNLTLLHVRPTWVAMAFNTALGFFLGGISLSAIALNRPKFALLATVFAALLAIPTLLEYLPGVSFSVDQIFFHAYTRAGITNPARMAFCTALSFTLLGIVALLEQPVFAASKRRTIVVATLGAIIASLGVIALSGYFTGTDISYTWGQLTRMAVHTAIGFVATGIGVIAYASKQNRAAESEGDIVTAVLGVGTAAGALCLWQALVVADSAQLNIIRNFEASHGGATLESISHLQSMLTTGALIIGLSMAVLLMVASSLGFTARRHAEKLAIEVGERKLAQSQLQAARDELEVRVVERTSELADSNLQLAEAHAQLQENAARQRNFLRDVLASVTEGKLRLCDSLDDFPKPPAPFSSLIELTREDIKSVREEALRAANFVGMSDDRACDLVTSVGEAAMNAVMHGGGGNAWIYVNRQDAVQVWIADHGKGIDIANLHQATLRRGFTTAGSFGHGFWMMLNTVDTIWLLTGPTGTTVALEQHRLEPEPFWVEAFSVTSHSA